MTGSDRSIRTIAVAGGGLVALSAAIAFARALPKVRVELLETPVDPAALADRLTGSLTAIHGFHASIGLDELELVRSGAATHRLGTRFEGWSTDGASWHHMFGDYGLEAGKVAFHHLWARARREGKGPAFDRYAAAALLAEAGAFVHPEQAPKPARLAYSYALRLDPERYREMLAAMARRLPLSWTRGAIGGVERREDGGITALLLGDGRRLEADLFIDCDGPGAPLLSQLDERFEDWEPWLPCDRLLIGYAPNGDGPSTLDVTTATGIGWRGAAPLPETKLVTLAYASGLTEEGQARRVLASEAGIEDAGAVAIRPGRRPEAWVRNVLAVGDAAVAVDPLEATNLHLAQSAIKRAIGLLPGRDCHPLVLREYNRRTDQQLLRVRDFLALHYLRSGRSQGEFWQSLKGRALPDSLAHTLEQFERRGRLPFYEIESFDKHGWLAVLLGMGILPRDTDSVASGVDPEAAKAGMKRLAESLARLPAQLPTYPDYLRRMREVRR